MRFTHSINAVKCLEWDITLSEGALMDLINQASSWAEPSMVDGKIYYWMSRNKVIDEIPVAYKKADTVYRAFKTLASKGLISYIKDGRRDLVAFTEKGKTWNVKGTDIGDAKLGNKSELAQNSEINPSKLGNKSEKQAENTDLNPTDKNTNYKSISNKKRKPKTESKKEDVFNLVKPEQVSDQVWNDLLALRKKKGAVESQTAWTRINNSIERAQQATGHTLENIFSYWVMRAWAGFDEKWYINAHPQPTNTYQGNTHAAHQSVNSQPKSKTEQYRDMLNEQHTAKYGHQPAERTVN